MADKQQPKEEAVLKEAEPIKTEPVKPTIYEEPVKARKVVKTVSSLGTMGISIKGNTGNAQEANEAAQYKTSQIKNEKPIDPSELQKVWKNMIDEIAHEKVHLEHTLKSHHPSLEPDGFTLVLTVHNNIQEKRIAEDMDEILHYLKEKLQNDLMKLTIIVDETVEEKKFFTNTEKLQLMVSRNPDLNLLRKLFDLDLE